MSDLGIKIPKVIRLMKDLIKQIQAYFHIEPSRPPRMPRQLVREYLYAVALYEAALMIGTMKKMDRMNIMPCAISVSVAKIFPNIVVTRTTNTVPTSMMNKKPLKSSAPVPVYSKRSPRRLKLDAAYLRALTLPQKE